MPNSDTRPEAAVSPAGPTRSENAYGQLRQEILRGNLKPGGKLKIEELQRLYSYSNTPLREALSRLAAEGLVTADGRRGFRVCPMSVADFQDLTAFRLVLESAAIEAAMEKGDDDWEAEIFSAAYRLDLIEGEKGRDRRSQSEIWTDRHKAFHRALVAACGSTRLLAAWSEMFDQAERYRRLSGRHRKKPRDARVEHRKLARLAVARDPAAVDLLRDHIARTALNVVGILESQAGAADAGGE